MPVSERLRQSCCEDIMTKRQSICILSLSAVARDGRVLRQIEYLVQRYDLTLICYGPPHPRWENHPHVEWVQLEQAIPVKQVLSDLIQFRPTSLTKRVVSELRRLIFFLTLRLGKLTPRLYEIGYTLRWWAMRNLHQALNRPHHAFHANDWDTVLLAAQAAQRQGAKLVIDLHEYAPLQFNHQANWSRSQAMISYILQKYGPQADAVTTVAPLLADKYAEEFGFKPTVVMNAPVRASLKSTQLDPKHIRLVHHGMSTPLRRPEVMIEAVAQSDERYSLHLMLLPSDYLHDLQRLANQLAPGRVFFHEPVPPDQIVTRISEYDVGFCYIPPTTYNYLYSLPNKFLESVAAGLAVCIGPSPSMAAVVEQYGLGCIAPSFEPAALAATLNQTTTEQWRAMREAAQRAANELNADHEMQKVLDIYQRLLHNHTAVEMTTGLSPRLS